jgi:hypothetical protein
MLHLFLIGIRVACPDLLLESPLQRLVRRGDQRKRPICNMALAVFSFSLRRGTPPAACEALGFLTPFLRHLHEGFEVSSLYSLHRPEVV